MDAPLCHLGLFRQHGQLRRCVAIILAGVMASGCMTWRAMYDESPGQVIARSPHHVRVHLDRGDPADLYEPTIDGSELVGYGWPGYEAPRIAIPLSEVDFVEVHRVDAGRTAALVTTVGGTVAILAILLPSLHTGSGGGGGSCDTGACVRF